MGKVTKIETFTREVEYHVCDKCGIQIEKLPDGWWELINLGTKKNEGWTGPNSLLFCGGCVIPLTHKGWNGDK